MPDISLTQTRLPVFGSMAQIPASSPPGVSVVVCCHNSKGRLGPTLKYLACQTVGAAIPWEVIIIDNASTDDSGAFAQESWPKNAPAPLRVVSEPNPGLAHARLRGLNEAAYPIVSLVDDDNWVCPEWISLVSDIMSTRPAVGAVGCLCEGAYEQSPPAWFLEFSRSYAIGEMAFEAANVTWTRGYLFGAGLSIRKCAWQSLREHGFTPLLTDRAGASLTS
ncbi:MAG TPA: glycosyltransferase, partial [Verrucomicrobiae bacterium]